MIFFSQNWFWQSHIFQPQLAMQRFIYCVHICDTQTYYSGISVSEPKASTHTHTCRQHSHHTERENDTTNGGLPPSVLSAQPFVCGVNVGGLLCGTSIESIESIKSIESIESVESSDSIESIESTQSIEPIESIEFWESNILSWKALFKKVRFRPRDPSKKFKHDVRISLVQFSASELHEVSSYGRSRVQKAKIRILRR